ncbi:hypothetical protein [Eoetvoesiella caeni]|uniref:Antitoxin n=1 Tax=Eoetvoesiella caeni TaxID=645616 RepID=A0A366GZV5_9BURK|nr:hypothetical protein [Eoetvoesiella caeni]MCI2811191.1 type II toxin-antitoxin system Phd/YefM family antitoxin [Eoetvoesiella caeni]NYT57045.1 hypothetical protein [Eoetvoesiella caeni]RBP35004.1 hypothetical protein DFR37_1225 [Eoetvoesiella caeni]
MRSISTAEIEKQGWDFVTLALSQSNRIAVTHDGNVEAVILTPSEYAQLIEDQGKAEGLAALRARFDAELASLNEPGAGERLRSIMSEPTKLHGQVKVGDTF